MGEYIWAKTKSYATGENMPGSLDITRIEGCGVGLGSQDSVSSKNLIDHFTVVCSVTWLLYGSEASVDLVLIQTSLLLLCKTSCSDAN